MDEEKLPVRVVKSVPKRSGRRPGGGPSRNFFETKEEFSQRQKSLIQDVDSVEEYFKKSFEKYPHIPHVSKVQLIEEAIAKSHRPIYLFSKSTCPIIGVGELGLLFVRTEQERLHYLKEKIGEEPSGKTTKNKWKANISVVSNFNAFKENDRLKGKTPEFLMELLEHDGRSAVKVKLFDFFDRQTNTSVNKNFISFVNNLNLPLDMVGDRTGLRIWKIEEIDIESLKKLATFPAVQELSLFPRYKVIQPSKKEPTSSVLVPSPRSEEYPTVGLLDTGMPENHSLSSWVSESTSFLRPELSNHFHGCSVGALLIMAHHFNSSLDIDKGFLKIVSVEVLGNSEKDHGEVDVVYEDEFIRRLENYFEPSQITPKIWNMSLGFPETCEFKRFSDLALFLDKLQDRHDLIFVLPTGNYDEEPWRGWPPQSEVIEIDHLCGDDPVIPPDYLDKPADCVRAVTVGAIACEEKAGSLVHKDQPTSYSRKGPGPSFIPKPEVVHYSGNILVSEDGKPDYIGQGIKSMDESGQIRDCIGTSYAAPLISRNLAFLEHYVEPKPSSLLLKALLIHNARILESFGNPEKLFYYVGFGYPAKAIEALFCPPYEITLIFEDKIQPGKKLEYPFYWPGSLKIYEGGIVGEIRATLVSSPPLNEAFGAEYIRADVRFSLLSKTIDSAGKEKWESIVPEDPCRWELRKRYESVLIKEAFKWSPVKKYCAKFRDKKSEKLKMKIELFLRDGLDMDNFNDNVAFALILTIRDPKERTPIYDEVTLGLHSLGIITDGIRIRGRAREKIH